MAVSGNLDLDPAVIARSPLLGFIEARRSYMLVESP